MTHIKKGLPEYPPSAHTKNSRSIESEIIAIPFSILILEQP